MAQGHDADLNLRGIADLRDLALKSLTGKRIHGEFHVLGDSNQADVGLGNVCFGSPSTARPTMVARHNSAELKNHRINRPVESSKRRESTTMTTLSNVVLPSPFRPATPIRWPFSNMKLNPRNKVRPPRSMPR